MSQVIEAALAYGMRVPSNVEYEVPRGLEIATAGNGCLAVVIPESLIEVRMADGFVPVMSHELHVPQEWFNLVTDFAENHKLRGRVAAWLLYVC
jgi:hypothetical protein